jgi:hypothetical protein
VISLRTLRGGGCRPADDRSAPGRG